MPQVFSKQMETLSKILKITGLVIMGLGILLSLFDLLGWYEDSEKVGVLNWATTSGVGMPIEEPGAQKFMKDFPPPNGTNKKVTHLTKQVIKSELGGKVMQVSVNYMYSDATRTHFVANLNDIEDWSKKTPYPWIAWALSCLGFVEVLVSFTMKKPNKGIN